MLPTTVLYQENFNDLPRNLKAVVWEDRHALHDLDAQGMLEGLRQGMLPSGKEQHWFTLVDDDVQCSTHRYIYSRTDDLCHLMLAPESGPIVLMLVKEGYGQDLFSVRYDEQDAEMDRLDQLDDELPVEDVVSRSHGHASFVDWEGKPNVFLINLSAIKSMNKEVPVDISSHDLSERIFDEIQIIGLASDQDVTVYVDHDVATVTVSLSNVGAGSGSVEIVHEGKIIDELENEELMKSISLTHHHFDEGSDDFSCVDPDDEPEPDD